MNAFNGASEPDIEEAYLKAEPKILSPASPKPIHFPQPSNIPVLDNMMDVGFNQTEAHMDANSRDTELRPGAWRDPAESDQPSPFSTGGNPNGSNAEANDAETSQAEATNSTEALSNGHSTETFQISNGLSYAANSFSRQDDAPSISTAQEAYAASPKRSASSVSVTSTTYDAGEAEQTFNALQAQSAETSSAAQPTPFPSSVNVQALLDTLSTSMTPAANVAPTHEGLTAATAQSHSQSQAQPPAPGAIAPSPVAASPSGLPPRPPAQEQPLMNPNYAHSQHIRDYHPHATNPATQTTHAQALPAHNAANPAEAQSGLFASLGNGANYPTQQSPTSAPVPPPVNQAPAQQYPQQYPSTNAPIESRREYKVAAGETPSSDDQPFPPDVQRKYDHFMEEERRYVNEARWDQFPNNSRLFVGNLSSEKVTKRDIFHVFHSYGELAQISIKQAYGFVQFLRTEDCMRALDAEQGRQIRDKRIHLEISKPQKPSRNQQQQNHGRRSRSPDNRRGQGSGRYDDRRGGRRDVRESRERDDYYARTSSPPPRGRDDRYARTYNRRSRSPSYGRGGRYRSPPPEPDDDLPLPRRQPRDVPDVQVIVLDSLHRDFLSWVEREFSSRSVRVDVLTISQARFDEQAVVRRQIMEGVIAVCKLRRVNQDTSKIGLTIFKRRGGTRDVQFEEYDNLDPSICAELVIRERQSLRTPAAQPTYGGYSGQQYAAPPPQQQYGYQQPPAPYPGPPVGPPIGYPPGYGQPRPTPQFAGQPPVPMLPPGYPPQQPPAPRVDSNNLQNLLSTLNTASPAGPPQQQPYGMPPRPGYPPTQSYQQYPPAHSTPAQAPQPPTPGQAPQNMQDILARLSTYRQ